MNHTTNRAKVREALDVWNAAPWSANTSPALYFHYVMPYRVGQESAQDWHAELRTKLEGRVEGLDLAQAAIEVNRWCNERVDFVSTGAKDQPRLATFCCIAKMEQPRSTRPPLTPIQM